MEEKETLEEMSMRFNHNPDAFICSEALKLFYNAKNNEEALEALGMLERVAQL